MAAHNEDRHSIYDIWILLDYYSIDEKRVRCYVNLDLFY